MVELNYFILNKIMSLVYIYMGSEIYPFTDDMIKKLTIINSMLSDNPPTNNEVHINKIANFDKLYKWLINVADISLDLLLIANQLEVDEILNEIKRNIRKFSVEDLLDNYDRYRDIPEIRSKAGIYIFLSGNETEWAKSEFMEAFKRKYPDYQIDAYLNFSDHQGTNFKLIFSHGFKKIAIDREKRYFVEYDGRETYFLSPPEDELIYVPPGNGPVYVITYDDIYFGLSYSNSFIFKRKITSSLTEVILSKHDDLEKGDMIYLPYYDQIDIPFLIYNEIELVKLAEYQAHSKLPGRDFPFIEFSLEFFHIFVVTGINKNNMRFVDKHFIELYNSVQGKVIDFYVTKNLRINGKDYIFKSLIRTLDPVKTYLIRYFSDEEDERMINGTYNEYIVEEISPFEFGAYWIL